MSSSEIRRGAVLDAAALAAHETARAVSWLPLDEHEGGHVAADAVALHDFGAFDDVLGALPADAPLAPDGVDAEIDALLPDLSAYLRTHAAAPVAGLGPDALAEHEAALREQLEAEFALRAQADAQRHEEELAQAYAAGVEAGQAEATAAAERILADATRALAEAREQLAAHEERWLANLRENVAVLAVAVARHVIGREVASEDALVQALAAQAIAEFPIDQPLALRVHPLDLPTLRTAYDAQGGRELRWIPDERVARGGCLIEGRDRIVDGRVDAALERVYRTLSGFHA